MNYAATQMTFANNEQIAYALITSETMFANQLNIDDAFDLYERALAEVNDYNRYQIADILKQNGSQVEVLSSNV